MHFLVSLDIHITCLQVLNITTNIFWEVIHLPPPNGLKAQRRIWWQGREPPLKWLELVFSDESVGHSMVLGSQEAHNVYHTVGFWGQESHFVLLVCHDHYSFVLLLRHWFLVLLRCNFAWKSWPKKMRMGAPEQPNHWNVTTKTLTSMEVWALCPQRQWDDQCNSWEWITTWRIALSTDDLLLYIWSFFPM